VVNKHAFVRHFLRCSTAAVMAVLPNPMHVKRSVTVEVLFTRLALVTASGQVHDLPRFE
jgi:hypothetical protein